MHEAVEDENVEVVKLLMSRADINVNAKYIVSYSFSNNILNEIIFLNKIQIL